MCFSFEISITTFIISWGISLYLLNKKLKLHQKQNIIFLMIFSSMQLADAILWYIKMKKNNINYIITSYLIPTLLSLQILYNVFIIQKNTNLYISLATICICIYIFYKFNGYSISLCNNKLASPIWGSNEIKLWEFILFAMIVLYPNWNVFTIVILFLYIPVNFLIGGSYGSIWCAIANIGSFYYLYKYRNIENKILKY